MLTPRFIQMALPSASTLLCMLTLLSNTLFTSQLAAQPNYTADEKVTPYTGLFAPGYNQGYYQGWNDQTLGNLGAGNPSLGIRGVGAKSLRQGLYYELLKTWGQGVRLPEVQHYKALGMGELTALILGGGNGGTQPAPPNDVRDLTNYCAGYPSELFANMYLPIWDGGANGTPYNDQNHYAKYLYETVVIYKDYVRFWEIWNEPGFDYTGNIGWRPAGDAVGNWWDRDPLPCEYKLRAPIEHYVRMLRISYEIIKTIDPNAYVTMSSPGFPSFLDAVLRNTDNPNGGSITADYPKTGGAYFDCIAFHAYPHFDGSSIVDAWTNTFMRNSDRSAEGLMWYRNNLQAVFNARGYDGVQKPKKEFIVTEINLPRQRFTSPTYFGSAEAQRNYLAKAFVTAKREKIHQLHVYLIGEQRKEADAAYEFDLMGLYKNLDNVPASAVQYNDEGIAWKTASDLLYMSYHDAGASFGLNTGTDVRGEAFRRPDGKYVYVLWAKCKTDLSENASATYTFPAHMQVQNAEVHQWNSGVGSSPQTFSSLTTVQLTGSPIYIVADVSVGTEESAPWADLILSPNPVSAGQIAVLQYQLSEPQNVQASVIDAKGDLVAEFAEGDQKTGTQILSIRTEGWASGVYRVILKNRKGEQLAQSLVVVQ